MREKNKAQGWRDLMSVSNNGKVEMEIHVVNLTGPLNERQFEDVTRLFKDLAEQGVKRIVVNLAEVPLIDSRG
jgi:anti-anti-sigma regulatory factor